MLPGAATPAPGSSSAQHAQNLHQQPVAMWHGRPEAAAAATHMVYTVKQVTMHAAPYPCAPGTSLLQQYSLAACSSMTLPNYLGCPLLRCPVQPVQLQLNLQLSLLCSNPLGRQLLEGMTPVVSSLTLCHAVCCRVANMYFLFIAALQLIPGLSPTSWVTTVAPLCFVLFINGVKVGRPGLLSVTCCASKLQPA